MYAVIKTGGKQYRIQAGDVVEIERIAAKSDTVTFAPLLVSTDDGHTLHGEAAREFPVTAKLLGEAKGDKVVVFKYKNKTGYANRTGHRQLYSLIEITSIGQKAAEEPTQEPAAEPVVEDAVTEEPIAEVAVAEDPAVEEPAVEEPLAEEA